MLSAHQHQDIARSSYADMLNDDERNRAYDLAIRINISFMVKSKEYNPSGDRFFKCCDIGTGSGLLSMMIVRAFQGLEYDNFHVSAFEAFQPMASCAQRVIDSNGMSSFITVIPTYSDQIYGGPKFDLLVAELLDTELIGEGCLNVYRHAIENLCSPTCLFVPYQARIYIEPIASSFLFQRHAIDDLEFNLGENKAVLVELTKEIKDCCGMPEIDDMQASALREGQDFIRISESQVVFHFKFNNLDSLKLADHVKLEFVIKKEVDQPPVVVMWWDIIMYDKALHDCYQHIDDPLNISLNVLSCAPVWARSKSLHERDATIHEFYGRDVWREHWIQGIYYFGHVKETRQLVGSLKGSTFSIYAYHDSHSLWFDLRPCDTKFPTNCQCGVHRGLSRSQLAFLSNTNQMTKLIAALLANKSFPIKGKIEFMQHSINDRIEDSGKWRIIFNKSNQLHPDESNLLVDLSIDDEIPWAKIFARFSNKLDINPIESFVIKFTQVEFDNLNRIRTKIDECEGFNFKDLDNMIGSSSNLIDEVLESHFNWEYSSKRLDTDHVIYSSLSDGAKQREQILSGAFWKPFHLTVAPDKLRLKENWKKGWALVFWAEFNLKNTGDVISTGPMKECSIGELIDWNNHCRQLVYFMHDHPKIPSNDLIVVDIDIGFHGSHLNVRPSTVRQSYQPS